MKLSKKNIYQKVVNSYLIDSPLPSNLTYMYNFGSLLGLTLVIMIITGVTQAMHYVANIDLAFSSVEHIMRDVNNGWLIRYIHANGAGFFFIFVYIHMARGLYFGSYRQPRSKLWYTGIVIYLIMMATAFIGYVLPYGSMSYWGATVITNLFSSIPWIGTDLVNQIWGGYSVDNPTLNRFFSLHFLLPFLLAGMILLHLMSLHEHGSTNPLGISSKSDNCRFTPYFTSKDLVGFQFAAIIFFIFVFYIPNYLNHPDNSIEANPLVTPSHITPEFYYLSFYAILRCIPNKQGGVLAMFGSILIQFILPIFSSQNLRSNNYKPQLRALYWIFVFNFLFLTWLGAQVIAEPYITLSIISTLIYFSYFILLCIIG